MKSYAKIALLFIGVAAIVLVLYVTKETSQPESGIIAEERARLARSKDNRRAEQDPLYAINFENNLRYTDYRLAVAYNSENRPDDAIAILERIIKDESQEKNGILRRSRSYATVARYYEALAKSFELKKEPDLMNKAMQSREEMLAKAAELRKKEDLAEGKSIDMKE